MNVLKYRVSLDMFDTHSQTTIKAKKGDSACQIYITLAKKGRLYDIGEGCSATFNARKSDGNFIYDNCTIENNTIVYDFTSSVDENGVCQVSACEGIVECEVTLYSADGKQLTSPRFTLFVDETVYNGEEIASTPQSDFFKEIVAEAVRTKQDFFALVSQGDTLFKKILTLINHTTFDASSGFAINSANGEISLGGKKIKLSSAELMELYANVGLFGSLTFPYGNGLINNLATPIGTDPTQAANVEFVKKSRNMRLLIDRTVTEDEVTANDGAGTAFVYSEDKDGKTFNLDAFHIFVDIPPALVKDVNMSVYFNGAGVTEGWNNGKCLFFMGAKQGAYGTFWAYAEKIADNKWRCMSTTMNSVSTSRVVYSHFEMEDVDLINSARVGGLLATGANFKIWGRDAI